MNHRTFRFLFSLAVLTLAWGASTAAVHAQTVDPVKAARVKAGYLWNFAKFTKWPDEVFTDGSTAVVIGVLGADPFGATLDKAVEGKTVENRSFLVRRLPPGSENDAAALRSCHILYVSESLQPKLKPIIATLGDAPVLVVGEGDNFSTGGGMIAFVLSGGNIRFHMNLDAVERTRLQLSSKLMTLAKVVYRKNKE